MAITPVTSFDQKGELILNADEVQSPPILRNDTNKELRISFTVTGTWCLYKSPTSDPALSVFTAQTDWKGYQLPKDIYDRYQWRVQGAPAGALMAIVGAKGSDSTKLASPDSVVLPPGHMVFFLNNNATPLFRTCQGQLSIKYACSLKNSVDASGVGPAPNKEPSANPVPVDPAKNPTATRTGRLLVLNDEWILSDYGFQQAPDTEVLAKNIARVFSGTNKAGRFLDISTIFTSGSKIRSTALEKVLTTAPYTFARDRSSPLDLKTLSAYDGVIVGRAPTDTKVLIDYIKQGGNVCVIAGALGGGAEALMWNPLLEAFGLRCDNFDNRIKGIQPANNPDHPLLAGVKSLYQDNGMTVHLLPNSKASIIMKAGSQGLIGYAEIPVASPGGTPSQAKEPSAKPVIVDPAKEPTTTRTGKLLVLHDEYMLSDHGFQQAPDTEIFVKNIAKYLIGNKGGKFLDYSTYYTTNPTVIGTSLEKILTSPPYGFKRDRSVALDLTTLRTYEVVFVGGEQADNQMLIDYIKLGGCVCLIAGTGHGGSESEASQWSQLLSAFGLRLESSYNDITGVLPVTSPSHPLFAGVNALFQYWGQTVQLLPDSKASIVMESGSHGLIGLAEVPVASSASPAVV
ncbi:MAG: hypothetical protein ACK5N0_00895 [Synechococcaceae cyanobacterium]